jgi:protocatechuate 4,5-dioxygenase beta chain
MLGLGLASSHAPALFCPPDAWPTVYAAIPEYMKGSQPHTAKLETHDVILKQIERIERAFATLRRELEAFKPDAVIFIGDDQGDMFNEAHMPQLAVFTGDEVWGSTTPSYMNEPPERSRLHIPAAADLARHIYKGLTRRGFDPANVARMQPLGRPERGMSHMVMYPHPKLLPRNDVPIVPIFINEYFPPMPTAQRCWDLGLALREIVDEWPGRVAIYASGGLSHDPAGPRAGWVDEPLDRWILERIARNEGERLTSLFTFDSDTLRGGTGEVRAWISVAGACRRPATVVEYLISHHAKVGLAWAHWPWPGAAAMRAAAE